MELLKTLFESAELPTDFKEKTTALFEAAVADKVKTDLVQIQESYDKQLDEAKAAFVAESIKSVDAVVESTILEWAKENAVALDSQAKGQIAESFLQGLKGVFEKADIELNGGTAGVELIKLQEANATLVAEGAATAKALTEAQDKLTSIARKEIVAEATAGLADTQIHRVSKLLEAFDFKSAEDFKAKAALIVEAVGGKIVATANADGTIIAIDSTTGKNSNTVDTGAGTHAPEDGELVTNPGSPSNTSAEGKTGTPEKTLGNVIKEGQDLAAPHLHSNLVEETLKLFR